jgi:hypothetical protein
VEKTYQINLKDMYLTFANTQEKLLIIVKMVKNMMFPLIVHHHIPKCLRSIVNNKYRIWHLRCEHLNFKSLK